MAIENVQQLLTEQLGKHRCDVITTTAMTSKDYYAIHFVTESVIASIAHLIFKQEQVHQQQVYTRL